MMLKDVIGQDILTQKFLCAWKQDRLAQGYILSGPDGVGKTPYAIELAKAFLCTEFAEGADDACEKCPSCRKVHHGNHEGMEIVKPSGAGRFIRMQDINGLIETLRLRTRANERRFLIISEADRMNEESANHFLKTLEEPPPNVTFLLLTARISAILPTIISRCQVVRMHRAPVEQIERFLLEREVEPQKAKLYALLADGCPGRAVGMEGAGMFERRNLMLERIIQINRENDAVVASDMLAANKASSSAATRENHYIELGLMAALLRDMTLLAEQGDKSLLYNADVADKLQSRVAGMNPARLRKVILQTLEARRRIESFIQPELVISTLMIDLAECG